MFKKILIANRGEIAVRIIRACREMGILSVAVYSTADKDSLHVKLADEAVCIGEAHAIKSYLDPHNIISATILSGADAIHPGFGFLSENARFAALCEKCSIKFIGPDWMTINDMGDKAEARKNMMNGGVEVIPGSDGCVSTIEECMKVAQEMGYPVAVKAAAGGGGKGIRIAWGVDEISKAFDTAKAEAKAAFGNDSMYIEKFIENPRHVEIQILGDNYGNIIHLGERDCSIQRRNQKMIEESPCPVMNDKLRKEMGMAAVRAAKAVNYKNSGTVEFLLDKQGKFYFMEMNTRIQVEHPVTEMVTGIDIVKEQIRIAAGEKLSITQESITFTGHAIECRINAEDPDRDFMPSPGKIEYLFFPGGNGVRIDSAVYQGYNLPPNYDSMIAKIIVHGSTRSEALSKMKSALSEFELKGIKTNVSFQMRILETPEFKDGNIDTGFIGRMMKADKV